MIRATDDKADLEALTMRIRGVENGEQVRPSEMTGDLRTVVMTHVSTLVKDSREKAPESVDPIPVPLEQDNPERSPDVEQDPAEPTDAEYAEIEDEANH